MSLNWDGSEYESASIVWSFCKYPTYLRQGTEVENHLREIISPENPNLQAGALVHCYTDGTVLVTHGGIEMGQGLHTKVAQIAAESLGIPLSAIFISETSTDKVPNASPTAASASSDLYGAAGNIQKIRWVNFN